MSAQPPPVHKPAGQSPAKPATCQPPAPSMAALPVDRSKTEPTPAYYKLQFGDEVTGFSYYVRTLAVLIGRNCERPGPVPPPAITSPTVPTNPPLDPNLPSPPANLFHGSILHTPPVADFPTPPASNQPAVNANGLPNPEMRTFSLAPPSPSTSAPAQQDGSGVGQSLTPEIHPYPGVGGGTASEGGDQAAASGVTAGQSDKMEVDGPLEMSMSSMKPEDYGALAEFAEAVKEEEIAQFQAEAEAAKLVVPEGGVEGADGLEGVFVGDAEIKMEMTDVPPPPLPPLPPPPPPAKTSATVEHVDVDLGPLKSVSRNHARIEYRADLGRFCLEILGRNGAWIDDRYYLKGALVPLAQGSTIQIATRIFSFVLPPSPANSPNYTQYLDGHIPEHAEHLPYPYNLPPNQVGYQEFYGEAGPGPVSAAAMAARAPPAFNAFAAADGYGLGLGMELDDRAWLEGESDDESGSDWEGEGEGDGKGADGQEWSSDEEDSDESSGEEFQGEQESDDYEEEAAAAAARPRASVKISVKVPAIVPGEDESDLSSASSEPEEVEVKPVKKGKKQQPQLPPPKPANKKAAASKADSRRQSVADSVVEVEKVGKTGGKQPAKGGMAKAAAAAVAAAASKKEAKSKKKDKVKEEVIDVDMEEAPVDKASPVKKPKKTGKVAADVSASGGEEKESKAALAKKDAKKKVKPAPAVEETKTASPVKAAPALAAKAAPQGPVAPTLAAALTTPSTPVRPPGPAQQAAVRPPVPGQPAQPGAVRPPGQTQPGQPMAARPPGQPGVRPPGQAHPPPHPGHPQGHPSTTPQAGAHPHPHAAARPSPHGIPPRAAPTAMSGASPTPQPMQPFYCTELRETPGRPGHIIVNVPIPPSGAGPRPPPGPILGLDGLPFIGPPPLKPTSTFATIIHRALQFLPRGRGTLGEVCNWVAGEWEWFRLNVDSGWQNSIRHNLSLNKAFLKVPRIPEDDPESKGSVWIIDPEEGPLFEEKQRRDALKSASKDKNAESRREKERIRAEERAKKQREAAIEAARNAQSHPHPHPGQQMMPQQQQHLQQQHHQQQQHHHPQQHQQHPQQQQQPRPLPVQPRAMAVRPPPPPAPAPQPPQPAQPVSANAKGVLQPKAKIVVVMQPITPVMRQKSVIATTDVNGNPLPFVCDGTTLVLDQQTFGHLTTDILDKLTLLGAAGAVDVLSAWVINKNKQQATKAAQQAKAGGPVGAGAAGMAAKNGMANGVARPPNGVAAAPPRPVQQPAKPAPQPVKPPVPSSSSGPSGATSSNPPRPAAPGGKPLPGPAPPGTSLTKVIGMIAAVANAKGDVNTVGPNASALLRYIRVVGVDIDLRVAERIWATGVVPPLPAKKVGAKLKGQPGAAQGAKPPGVAGAANGAASTGAAGATGAAGTAGTAGVKRKLDEGTGGSGAASGGVSGGGGNGGGAGAQGSMEQDAKKPRIETSNV